jgi:ABC-type phosphate transport system permease subunit
MNLRKIWNWATAACGLIVLISDYINGAQLATYFDEHAIFNNNGLSGVPSIVLGIVGIVLIVGGTVAALQERK